MCRSSGPRKSWRASKRRSAVACRDLRLRHRPARRVCDAEQGAHILLALRTLDDILRRMQAHQNKKRSMLRPPGVGAPLSGRVVPGARGGVLTAVGTVS